ncbi:DUF4326 domain-containing protein [Fulvimarina endophytica]|uniref:DUF4326 domain-containing protein n=1 Tax=Fulvimarina endophytica TaxID=2293836 RepID=A0A371XB58_9HYPH|nr:DUF4326 domain-containing protein [Fulvimarina endophytica]RFC66467.1 DUF4326 domain-containing protein [Fulvimarina endophytica]
MDDQPKRVQLKRTKGWRMPPNTVKVTRPGPFGNPFSIAFCQAWFQMNYSDARAKAVSLFREWVNGDLDSKWTEAKKPDLSQIRGKNLACFCPLDAPCHADVLLEIANRPVCEDAA